MTGETLVPRGPGAIRDDLVLPFQVEPYGLRGRLVTLGTAVNSILKPHDHPEPVARLLAELLALAACLADTLKYDGVFTLQVNGDGPVKTLMADVTSEGALRGYAGFDTDAVSVAEARYGTDMALHRLTGGGYIALTVDQGNRAERYQGLVALSGSTLTECATAYFRESEQIGTGLVAAADRQPGGAWRASALMIQRLAFGGGDTIPAGVSEDEYDEEWRSALVLMSSCTTSELLDPVLAPEVLLYRLFHETGVRVYPEHSLVARCRCSHDRVVAVLRSLTAEQIADMTVDGQVTVTCEFCKTVRCFDWTDLVDLRRTPHA